MLKLSLKILTVLTMTAMLIACYVGIMTAQKNMGLDKTTVETSTQTVKTEELECLYGYDPKDAYELDCWEIAQALKDPRVHEDAKLELRTELKRQHKERRDEIEFHEQKPKQNLDFTEVENTLKNPGVFYSVKEGLLIALRKHPESKTARTLLEKYKDSGYPKDNGYPKD